MLDYLIQLDFSLFHLINVTLTNKYFDYFFPLITDLHKTIYFKVIVYPLIFAFFVWKFKKRGILIFLFCALTVASADLIGNHAFKKTFQRPRPATNASIEKVVRSPYGGYSFVSNHAANMFAFAFFMSAFLPKGRRWFYLLAGLIAFSRVYNGVHYPSDVLVGAILGTIIAATGVYILRNLILKEPKEIA